MNTGDDDVEPPAGISFANINVENIFNNIGGYEIIQKPYGNNVHHHRVDTKKLFKKESQVIYPSKYKEKRLRLLSNLGYVNELQSFIESCSDIESIINIADSRKRTALHFAASRGFGDIVHILLQHGADPNSQDFNGNTPLHLAACTQHIKVITHLMKYGADVRKTDRFGKNPLNICLSRLRMLKRKSNSILTMKLKDDVSDIVSMLQEYFVQCGRESEHIRLCEIGRKLIEAHTNESVDEVGALLENLTHMSLNTTDVERNETIVPNG